MSVQSWPTLHAALDGREPAHPWEHAHLAVTLGPDLVMVVTPVKLTDGPIVRGGKAVTVADAAGNHLATLALGELGPGILQIAAETARALFPDHASPA